MKLIFLWFTFCLSELFHLPAGVMLWWYRRKYRLPWQLWSHLYWTIVRRLLCDVIHVIPPSSSRSSLKWAIKFLLKYTNFYQNFEISLIWMKNSSYIFYTLFINLPEMKGKPPWFPFETYHTYYTASQIALVVCREMSVTCWDLPIIYFFPNFGILLTQKG